MKSAGEILLLLRQIEQAALEVNDFGVEQGVIKNISIYHEFNEDVNSYVRELEKKILGHYAAIYARVELKDIDKGKE